MLLFFKKGMKEFFGYSLDYRRGTLNINIYTFMRKHENREAPEQGSQVFLDMQMKDKRLRHFMKKKDIL